MKTYTQDEVRRESLAFFSNNELRTDVYAGKYALRSGDVFYESKPPETSMRLAKEFARAESKFPNPMMLAEVYGLLMKLDYDRIESDPGCETESELIDAATQYGEIMPQGSPTAAMGNWLQIQSLSNCFVIEAPYDSYGGICHTDEEQAQIMKRRGGVGFDISTIRPKGQPTSNAARTTDGVGVFMKRYSDTTEEVAQNGRRGALMLTISINHPEVETFINIKRDKKNVNGANVSVRVTDEFMQAVKDDTEYTLRFPVEASIEEAEITKVVRAKDIWDQIIDAAWYSAEPGILFWDTAKKWSPADAYEEFGYGSTSTNPCLTADVQIAVADGRGYVPIGELAEAGVDVPVYTVDEKGKIVVKTMRNPRLTGKNKPVFKVTIEGGHTFKATGNHKMIMRDGTRRRVDELESGDQLMISKRVEKTLVESGSTKRSSNPNHYVMIENHVSSQSEHRLIWIHHNGLVPKGSVIHHVDFNSKNNTVENLRCMTWKDHKELHAVEMRGEKNPIFKIKADPKRFADYSAKMSESTSGLKNPRSYDVSNDEIVNALRTITLDLGRRPSLKEWQALSVRLGLPPNLSRFRQRELGSFMQLSQKIATELDLHCAATADPRLQRTLQAAENQGYDADIIGNEVIVSRTCEWCGNNFTNNYGRREVAFCSHSCSNKHANRIAGKNEKHSESLRKVHAEKASKNKSDILNLFTQMRFELGRNPLQKELATSCKEMGVPYRTGTKYGFKNWEDVCEHAQSHNHRVVCIEPCGHEDVYNGMVDDEHNFCIGGWVGQNNERIQLHTQNCGEIVLSPYDSCRLQVLELRHFVVNPWMEDAYFDHKKFEASVMKAQRLMDDLVELEIEAIDRIIKKIESDPEPIHIKVNELSLWQKIREAAINGRRTGLGPTAVGDALAMFGVKYGSDESIGVVESIYETLAIGSYKSSIDLAKERGHFPVWSWEKDKDHPFLMRIYDRLPAVYQERWKKFGRRSIANTTTAPAGSVSIVLDSTSGIECLFSVDPYNRRRKVDKKGPGVEEDDKGILWQTYPVYHKGIQDWMTVTGEDDVTKSPYYGACAMDYDWINGVHLQAAAQKWVCHSISRTANLPKNATHDLISQVYMTAWESGCKGFTAYRDGSRTGVLQLTGQVAQGWMDGIPDEELQKMIDIGRKFDYTMPTQYLDFLNEASEELNRRNEGSFALAPQVFRAPDKRPKRLPCDIHRARVMVNGESDTYLVLVGTHKDKPYEIFCGLTKHVDLPRKYDTGWIVKNGRKKSGNVATYNLYIGEGEDEIVFKDIVEQFDNPIYGAFSRTISLALRHHVPVQYIVEQLQKDKNSDIASWARVVARILKTYIPDGTMTSLDKICPECGSESIVYQQGCPSCMSCGWTKCL